MALSQGTRLGPYEILSLLGKGGMGEVFLASDTRLHRTVAIKILPPDKVADPERKRRFLQEARAASALNHPNIVTLYDIAHDSGVDYLVLEYVPGKSLDQVMARRLPLMEALGYAQQMAGALAAAHAAGIVHRDIKPANVMMTPESQVKILDFGLAKLTERTSTSEGDTETVESAITETGSVMGTVSYMSPEQASAQPLDHRSDLFSLGVVLYEMLVGERPFRGKSQVETLCAIIKDPPPPPNTPLPRLNEVLDKVLQKDPKERYQSAADLAVDLRRLQRAAPAAPAAPPSPWPAWVKIAASAIVVAVGVAGWILRPSPEVDNPLIDAKFTRLTDFPGDEAQAAISPDGKFVAFLADRDGPLDIWLGQVGSGRFVNLTQGKEPNLRDAIRAVGFSGDGSEIWVHEADQEGAVRIMPLMGGQPRAFLPKRSQNVAWSPDGERIVYHTADPGDRLLVADRTGANPRQIFVNQSGAHNHFPVWSPDSKWIYFVRGFPDANAMDLWRIAPAGGQPERLTQHNSLVAYPTPIDTRLLVYVARDTDGSGPWLWALDTRWKTTRRVSFGLEQYMSIAASTNGRRLVATVANPVANLWSVPILDRIVEERDVKPYQVPTVRALMPRFGGSGLFYLSSLGTGDGLWRYDNGQVLEVWKGAEGTLLEPPAPSLDGRRVAFVLRRNGRTRLQIETADGTEPQVLGEGLVEVGGTASWSPDGKWVVIGGSDAKGAGLFKIPVDGSAPVRLAGGISLNPVWSPEGSLIVYGGPNVGAFSPLLAIRSDGTRIEWPAIGVQRNAARMRFLPDGKGLVYMQGESLRQQDFWLLDLATMKSRPLTHLANSAYMHTFDVTPSGKQIVFDRLRENSDVVLIDLARK